MRFGEGALHRIQYSPFRKIFFYIFGHDFIGAAIRQSHFSKYFSMIRNKNMKGKKETSTFLDAGCGAGDFTFYTAQNFPESRIYGYDIKEEIIKENKIIADKLGIKNVSFVKNDLLTLDEKDRYDFVISIGTLIYFSKEDTRKILKNIIKSMKKEGILYLDLPQEDFLEINIIPKKNYSNYYSQLKSENSGELYSYEDMKELLNELGLRIIFTNKSFGYFGKLAWELDNTLRERKLHKLRFLAIPIMKIFAFLDGNMKNKKGCCYVIASIKD